MLNHLLTPLQLSAGASIIIIILMCILIVPARAKAVKNYEARHSIFSPAEKYFYNVLLSIYKDRYIVLAKIRIADVVEVKKTLNQKEFWKVFSQVSQKNIDYLITDKNLNTLCVIELDDKSHYLRSDRIQRDKFINALMKETGIALYRIRVQRRYNRHEIKQTLSDCLSIE